MCVCVCEKESVSVYMPVHMCISPRGCLCARICAPHVCACMLRKCVCVCVCVRERERTLSRAELGLLFIQCITRPGDVYSSIFMLLPS